MTWLELDDRILEHPKFIRAAKLGGSEAIHLWLGIRAYCGQHLSDGFVPDDMLNEVRGPKDPKKRDAALNALKVVKLLDPAEGGLQMHNYLKWSSSREEVLKRRKAAAERKSRSRGGGDGGSDAGGSPRAGSRPSQRDTGDPNAGQKSESPTPARAFSPSPTSSTPLPPPPPDLAGEEEEEKVSGLQRLNPTNLESALLLPLQERAAYALSLRFEARFLQPQRWPEVVEAFRLMGEVWGQDLGVPGLYEKDAGTRAIVNIFAAGVTLDKFREFAKKSGDNPLFKNGNRALGVLSPEVVRRTLGGEFGSSPRQRGGPVQPSHDVDVLAPYRDSILR